MDTQDREWLTEDLPGVASIAKSVVKLELELDTPTVDIFGRVRTTLESDMYSDEIKRTDMFKHTYAMVVIANTFKNIDTTNAIIQNMKLARKEWVSNFIFNHALEYYKKDLQLDILSYWP